MWRRSPAEERLPPATKQPTRTQECARHTATHQLPNILSDPIPPQTQRSLQAHTLSMGRTLNKQSGVGIQKCRLHRPIGNSKQSVAETTSVCLYLYVRNVLWNHSTYGRAPSTRPTGTQRVAKKSKGNNEESPLKFFGLICCVQHGLLQNRSNESSRKATGSSGGATKTIQVSNHGGRKVKQSCKKFWTFRTSDSLTFRKAGKRSGSVNKYQRISLKSIGVC